MFENRFERELHLHGAGATFLLENRLKQMFGKKYCILTCSATAALEVTCHCLKITEKRVFTSSYQWPEMLVPFLTRNNKLFFAQHISPFHLGFFDDSSKFDVMFIVDSFGIAQDIQSGYQEYCKKNRCIYIHDASSSASSISFEGVPTGSLADIVITSFGPQKPFYGGEGGAILTDNESWYKKMVLFTDHPYRHISEGYIKNLFVHNYRMNPFGIEHLVEKFDDYLNEIHQKRIAYIKIYTDLLNNGLIGLNGPFYTEENSTFSPLIVELKDITLIPDNLKILNRQIKPVFAYPLPGGLKNASFHNKKKSVLNYDLISLELKDFHHDPSL